MRRWGDKAGRRYVTRIIQLSEARDFADIRALAALRAHRLKGARRGEWAIDLTERWRLIVRQTQPHTRSLIGSAKRPAA